MSSTTKKKLDYKSKRTLEERKRDYERIKKKYPNRIPIIVTKLTGSDIGDLKKNKYLIPNDITFGQFIYTIRKHLELKPEQAIYMFVKNNILPVSSMVSQIHKEFAEEDGFLYITYGAENTFGEFGEFGSP